jgi:hypothetical protein
MTIGYNFLGVGQVYEFLYLIPLRGIDEIGGFTDSITGEAAQRFFIKEFCYTVDGVNFSDYQTLDDTALSLINFDEKNDLLLKFRYTRSGTTTTGTLTLNSIRIDCTYTLKGLQILSFRRDGALSMFSTANKNFNESWFNFLDKIYHYGVLPTYVKRGDTDYDDFSEDDFITLFKSICYFYGLMDFLTEKNVSEFFSYRDEFSRFLQQRNIFLSGDETIAALTLLRNRFYRNISKRGTDDVFFEDGDYLNPESNPLHGEMRRILSYKYPDLFLYNFAGKGLTGWYLDSLTPGEYTDLYKAKGFNSFKEFTGSGLGVSYDPDNNVSYDMDQTEFCLSNQFKVDSRISLLVQFSIMKENINGRFTVEAIARDYTDTIINLQNHQSPNSTNNIFAASVNLARSSEFFTFFVLINPLGATLASSSTSNLGVGNNLRFSTSTQSLVLKITNSSSVASKIYFKDIFCTPIFSSSKTYLNSSPELTILMSQNNSNYQNDEILKRDIRRFLIPYSSFLNLQFISNQRNYSANEPYGWLLPDGNFWLTPDGEPWLLPN